MVIDLTQSFLFQKYILRNIQKCRQRLILKYYHCTIYESNNQEITYILKGRKAMDN
jgi:hypothetical protein